MFIRIITEIKKKRGLCNELYDALIAKAKALIASEYFISSIFILREALTAKPAVVKFVITIVFIMVQSVVAVLAVEIATIRQRIAEAETKNTKTLF